MADASKFKFNNIDWDRTPHILVGDRRHLSIYQAWEDIKKSRDAFHFYLFDKSWQKYDWRTPPSEDWDTLLRRRCIDLRKKFDWIRLWYSGGRDSHLVLESFIKNNISLDEIAVWYNPYDDSRGPEVEYIIKPLLEKIRLANPKIKITIVDIRLEDYEKFFSDEYWLEQQIGHPGGTWLFYPGQETTMALRRPDLFPQRDQGIRDVNIFGLEKPRLILENNRWFSQFIELEFAVHWGPSEISEMFYLCADMPELYAKQVWMLIDHIETKISSRDPEWINQYIAGKIDSAMYDDLCMALGRGPCTHPLIGLGTNKNRVNRFLKLIDWAQKTNWKPYINWSQHIKRMEKENKDIWNLDYQWTTGILSKKIFIKNFDSDRYDPDNKSSIIV